MTQEEKAKEFDASLERVKKLKETCDSTAVIGWCEYIFPMLKEPKTEDEKIRKEILAFIRREGQHIDKYKWHKWIAWLEKQGKKDVRYENLDQLLAADDIFQMAMNDDMVQEAKTKAINALSELPIGKLLLIEKQGEQKPFDYEHANIQQKDFAPQEDKPHFNIGDVVCDKLCTTLNKDKQPNLEIVDIRDGLYICDKGSFPISQQDEYELVAKKIEQNPADNVEPKFKVGDWVVNTVGDTNKVVKVWDDGYTLDNDVFLSNSWATEHYRLWTIEDASNGDVLVDIYGNIGIYEKCDDFSWMSYCSLGHNGGFQHFKIEHENENTYPATKEQKGLLFSKMHEEGWSWNATTNELSQSQVTNKGWSEEDEVMCQETIDWFEQKCFPYASEEENPARKSIQWLKSLKQRMQ